MKKNSLKCKKLLAIICSLIMMVTFSSCSCGWGPIWDKVIFSLGKCDSYDFYTSGGFQDYTNYGKYYYTSVTIEKNRYFEKVQEEDFLTIDKCLDEYEEWVELDKEYNETSELKNYDFDRVIIDTEDYFYIDAEETDWEDGLTSITSLNIYLWDSQTNVLYYFHNNI